MQKQLQHRSLRSREELIEELEIRQELLRRQAQTDFKAFVAYVQPDYQFKWFHDKIIKRITAVIDGEITRLMIFAPPRHGKSFLVSKLLPAFLFGINPDLKILGASYTAELATNVNADIQRIITSPKYRAVFPDVMLFNGGAKTITSTRRNRTGFDLVAYPGKYDAMGVGGSVTGKGFDWINADDLLKGFEQAESTSYRDKIWKWFNADLYTRLEKNAKVVLINTRWHEDDVSGRLLEMMRDGIGQKWEVLSFEALRRDLSDLDDPRLTGQPLWPEKYDTDELMSIQAQLGNRFFASLYQQTPSQVEGNIFKREWFEERYEPETVKGVVHFMIDSGYTKSERNDPTAIMSYINANRNINVTNCVTVRLEFPELVKFIEKHVLENGYTKASRIEIEPKASGLSLIQFLRTETNLNIVKGRVPKESKVARAHIVSSAFEGGRFRLPQLHKEETQPSWISDFIDELCSFPSAIHDDRVDVAISSIMREQLHSQPRMRTFRVIGGKRQEIDNLLRKPTIRPNLYSTKYPLTN